MAGRKAKPTKLKVLEGKRGAKSDLEKEPKPRPEAPEPPPGLSKEALEEWQHLAPILERLELITEVDYAAFGVYCQAYADWVHYNAMAQKKPLIKTPNGFLQMSPFVVLAEKAAKNLIGRASEFGLTPSGRSKIRLPSNGKRKDDLFT